MADTAISGLTAATDLAKDDLLEMVDTSATSNEKLTLAQLAEFVNGYNMARIATARTLTSTTSAQAIFDSANDTLTLTTGTYLFDGVIVLSSMSATSGNAQFQLLGGGTATLADQLFHMVGVDGATATAATQTGSTAVSNSSPASAMTAGTGAGMTINVRGSFEVTTGGTLIPSIALVTAAAAVVAAGSYLRVQRIGATNITAIGDWS